jgi:hypothetical protein
MSNGSYSVYKTLLNSLDVELDRENKLRKRKVEKKKKKEMNCVFSEKKVS